MILPFVLAASALGALASRWPQVSVGLALGLAMVTVIVVDVTLALVIYILAAYTILGPKPNVTTVLTGLIVVAWLARSGAPQLSRLRSLREVPGVALTAATLAAWLCVATLWAGDGHAARNVAVWFACDMVLFPIFYMAVHDARRLRWCLVAIVVAGGVAAVAALVMPTGPTNPYGGRAHGIIGDPNTLGADLLPSVVLGPLLFMKVIPREQTRTRALVLCCSALSLAATVATGSRGALVALGAVLLCSVVLFWRWRRAVISVVVVGATIGLASFATLVSADTRKHLSKSDSSGRTDVWVIGERMVKDHALVGVGPGNFRQESIHYLIRPGRYENPSTTERQFAAPLVAHNSYMQMLAETGVVGLGLYLAIWAGAVGCGLRAARIFARLREEALEVAVRGLLLVAAGLAVAIWFITYTAQGRGVWVVLALLVASYGLARRYEAEAGVRP
jgi:O-antigen ligase